MSDLWAIVIVVAAAAVAAGYVVLCDRVRG